MPKPKYLLNVDGKEHSVSVENIEKYTMQKYAADYPGATIRMRNDKDEDYDIPLTRYEWATNQGLRPFSIDVYDEGEEQADYTKPGVAQPDSIVGGVSRQATAEKPANVNSYKQSHEAAQQAAQPQQPQQPAYDWASGMRETWEPTKQPVEAKRDDTQIAPLNQQPAPDWGSALPKWEPKSPAKRTEATNEEDAAIDSTFEAKPVERAEDIYRNYQERFALTEEGQQLAAERQKVESDTIRKFWDEFTTTPEYQAIAGQKYKDQAEIDAASQQLNELFEQRYGQAVELAMKPYYEQVNEAITTRYGDRIDAEFEQLNSKVTTRLEDLYQKRIAPLFEKYRQDADAAARKAIMDDARSINRILPGGSGTTLPGMSGIASEKVKRETDPAKVMNEAAAMLTEMSQQDPELREEIAGIAKLLGKDNVDAFTEEVVQYARQRMTDDYIQENTPKNSFEYLMKAGFGSSMLGMVGDLANKSLTQRQIEQAGLQGYKPSEGEEIGAMFLGIAADLPMLAASGGVGGAVGKQLIKQQAAKLIASGISREVAEGIAMRAIQQTGMRWGLRAASEAATFAALEGAGSAIQQAYANGEIDPFEVMSSMGRGAGTGAVMGVFGVGNEIFKGGAKRMLGDTAGKALGYTTSLGGRTSILAGSSVMGQYMSDPAFDINNVDWTKEFTHAALMNVGFDVLGAVKRYAARKPGMKDIDLENFKLTKDNIEQLNAAGIEGSNAMEIAKSLLQLKDADLLRQSPEVEEGLASKEWAFVEQSLGVSKEGSALGRLLTDPNVDMATKAKIGYLMTGRAFEVVPSTRVSMEQDEAGNYIVTSFDPSGQTNETRRFANEAEARNYFTNAESDAKRNQVSALEGMINDAGKMASATELFDIVAKQFGMTREQIARIYAVGRNIEKSRESQRETLKEDKYQKLEGAERKKSKKDKQQNLNDIELEAYETLKTALKNIINTENFHYSTNELKRRMNEGYGEQEGWIDSVLKKDYKKLNDRERQAYNEYIDNMIRLLEGEQANAPAESATPAEPVAGLPGSPVTEGTTPPAPANSREGRMQQAAELFGRGDKGEIRGVGILHELAEERLAEVGIDEATRYDLANGSDAERQQIIDGLSGEQQRRAIDYVEKVDMYVGVNDAIDAKHEAAYDAAVRKIETMTGPNGKVNVVYLGDKADDTHHFGIVVNGLDANNQVTNSSKQVLVVPIETVDDRLNYSSFDENNVVSVRLDSVDDIGQYPTDYIEDVILPEYVQDIHTLDGRLPYIGEEVTIADADGNEGVVVVVDSHVLEGGDVEYIVMDKTTGTQDIISMDELRQMQQAAEQLPYRRAYQAEDARIQAEAAAAEKARIRAEQAAERARIKAEEEAAAAAERARQEAEARKPINRLKKYPEGHEKAGKPDYESSKPEDVRDYLVESLGVEDALKSVKAQSLKLDQDTESITNKLKEAKQKLSAGGFMPDEAIEARQQIGEMEAALEGIAKRRAFWDGVDVLIGGPKQEEMNKVIEKSEAAQRRKKAERKPSERYIQMLDEVADSEAASTILQDLEPHTPEELAAEMIANGVRLMKSDETVGGSVLKGFLSHTGYSHKDTERYPFIFAGRDKGGVSMQEFGEMLEAEASEHGISFDGKSTEEGLNALLGLLGKIEKQGDFALFIENRRMADAKAVIRSEQFEYERERDAAFEREYGLSYAEYEAAIDELTERYISERDLFINSEEYKDFIATFGNENLPKPVINDTGKEAGQEPASIGSGEAEGSPDVAGRDGGDVQGAQRSGVRPGSVIADGSNGGSRQSGRGDEASSSVEGGVQGSVPAGSGEVGKVFDIVEYSDKSIAVVGDTKAIKDELKKLGGRFNGRLNVGGKKVAGWIFPKGKRAEVEKLNKQKIADYGRSEQSDDAGQQADGSRMDQQRAKTLSGSSDRSGIRVFEEGLGVESTDNSERSTRVRQRAESERLVNIAKENGLYIEQKELDTLGEKYAKKTGESEVYFGGEKVFKVKDPYAKGAMKENAPEDAIFEHLVHNKYFPETEYQFLGISERDGDARIVLSQPKIESYETPTAKQIEQALSDKGLKRIDNYWWGNDEVAITDVEGDNVLLGTDGKVYFIDPIIKFKKPAKDILPTNKQEQKPREYDERGRETAASEAGHSRGKADIAESQADAIEEGSRLGERGTGRSEADSGTGTSVEGPRGKREKLTEYNGYKIGERILYKGQPAKIYEFEADGTPVLDTGMAPVIYEIGYWDNIEKVPAVTVESVLEGVKGRTPEAKLQKVKAATGKQGAEAIKAVKKETNKQRTAKRQEMATLFDEIDKQESALDAQERAIDEALALMPGYEAPKTTAVGELPHKASAKVLNKAAIKFAKAFASRVGGVLDTGKGSLQLANIAPIGGDVTFRVWLDDAHQHGVYMNIDVESEPGKKSDHDELVLSSGYWRIITAADPYGVKSSNNHFSLTDAAALKSGKTMSEIADKVLLALDRKIKKENEVELKPENNDRGTIQEEVRSVGSEPVENGEQLERRGNRASTPRVELGRETPEATEPSRGRGTSGSSDGSAELDAQRSDTVPGRGTAERVLDEAPAEAPVVYNQRNYSFGENHLDLPTGEIGKLKANTSAIRILKELEESGRDATAAEKEALKLFVGWGGLADALNTREYERWQTAKKYGSSTSWGDKWGKHYEALRPLMTDEEFADAQRSTLSSHYTPENVIRALWNGVEYLGFTGGDMLEPGMGVGHILGFMPKNLAERSKISGFEIDSLPGRIAQKLYPDANIRVAGYETAYAPNSKDAVVTNVPFGKVAPIDPRLDKTLRNKLGGAYNLHNYFIVKGLLELRPGGIGAFITSSATLDSKNGKAREYIASMGVDLVGAIRLPNHTFKGNAGTEVTADILFFRKRLPGEASNGVQFVGLTQIGEGTNEAYVEKPGYWSPVKEVVKVPLVINEYFAEHPEMMLGEIMTAHDAGSGGLYGGDSLTLVGDKKADLFMQIDDAIAKMERPMPQETAASTEPGKKSKKRRTSTGTLSVKEGKVYVKNEDGSQEEVTAGTFKHNKKVRSYADAAADYLALKESLRELIEAERTQESDPAALRKQVNEQYDAFVEKYGTLNENRNLNVILDEDAERFLPQSLEKVEKGIDPATGKRKVSVTKADGILTHRVSQPMIEPSKAESIQDAIGISQAYHGFLDVKYIAKLTGKDVKSAAEEVLATGAAYEDPETGNLIDKDEYLSGNVVEKLKVARDAAAEDSRYDANVSALEAVQPEAIPFVDISYKMGTPWIPVTVYEQFAENVMGLSGVEVRYMPEIDEFVVNDGYIADYAKSNEYSTNERKAMLLFKDAINLRKPVIYEKDAYGNRFKNEAATQDAVAKIVDINDAFKQYVEGRDDLHRQLQNIYNERYNNYRLREYSAPNFAKDEKGAIHYPNSNTAITLRDHQVKAVQRSLGASTLLAHQVGTGKTFTMITTAMEMRRLGIAKKPLIVVQNATLNDFAADFLKLYPGANILVPSEKERSASQRKRLFNMIATGDFDAIIIPQSFLAFIPDDIARKQALIQQRVEEIMNAADMLSTTDKRMADRLRKEADLILKSFEESEGIAPKGGKKANVKKEAEKEAKALSKETRKLNRRTDDVLTFEEMGIDALFIDEAHNYKKIGFSTKMQNVKGVDTGYSERANSLLLKASYVQERNGGRNVILATGTPITNTMAEVWTMMRFVAPEILEDYNIKTFDEFAATFGSVEPSLEYTSTGSFKIADRFKSYVNVPELVKAFRAHADVVLTSDVPEFKQSKAIPKLKDDKMTNHVIQKSEELQDVMDILIDALKEDEKKSGKERTPGLPLVVFSKAKQAAIDLRLLNPLFPDDPNSKTNLVISEAMRIYKESTPDKGVQMIFCDSYQSPGSKPTIDLFEYDESVPRFNLYQDIKQKLIDLGVPKEEIVIVSDLNNAERKKAVFEKARNGEVRILIGSTEKMGVGVNAQDRMIALHHIDAPIRPMDFEQRNGRILRQGNMYAAMDRPVEVLTYGVEGTLDATAYDRLRIKQEFINQMMKGDISGRVMEESADDDPSGKTFNQMAAELSGDKTAQLLFVAENDMKRLAGLERSHRLKVESARHDLSWERTQLRNHRASLTNAEADLEAVNGKFADGVTKVTANGVTFDEKLAKGLGEVVEAYEEKYSLNRGVAPLKVLLNGGAGELIYFHEDGKLHYALYVNGREISKRELASPAGAWLSLNYALASPAGAVKNAESSIAKSEAKIAGYESMLDKPFAKQAELDAAREQVKLLRAELEAKAKAESMGEGEIKMAYRGRGDIYYSNAEAAVSEIKQEKATPQQWLAMIEKGGGLKAGEDKWIGLSDWLKDQDAKSLTKQEVLDYIKANMIQVEDVQYGGSKEENEARHKALNDFYDKFMGEYGLDYEEHMTEADKLEEKRLRKAYERGKINQTRDRFTTIGLENKREIALVVPSIEPWHERDLVHFGDAGEGRAVAWVRFGETTDADGNRVLVIDEIQSKRHQVGRKHGYGVHSYKDYTIGEYKKVGSLQKAEIISKEGNVVGYVVLDEYGYWAESKDRSLMTSTRYTQEEAVEVLVKAFNPSVPDAPFEKNWQELAMKRMLRYAAENGFDKVAWTKGEQQVERYGIAKWIKSITVNVQPDGKRLVSLDYKNDEGYMDYYQMGVDSKGNIVNGDFNGNALSNVVGKELALKMMAVESREKFAGNGLRVGGEGMKGFYDEILPRFMNKYGKKWGVKVEEVALPDVEEAGRTMWSVDVTDAMKESVMAGQPMFKMDRHNLIERLKNFGKKALSLPMSEPMAGDSVESLDALDSELDAIRSIAVNAPDMIVAGMESDVAAALPGLSPIDFAKVMVEVRNKDAQALYIPWVRKVVLLSNRGTVKELRNAGWHESFHYGIDMALPDGIEKHFLLERAAAAAKNMDSNLAKWVEENYKPEARAEELVVHLMESVASWMADNGKIDKIRTGLDWGDKYLNDVSDRIINFLTNNGNNGKDEGNGANAERDARAYSEENSGWNDEEVTTAVQGSPQDEIALKEANYSVNQFINRVKNHAAFMITNSVDDLYVLRDYNVPEEKIQRYINDVTEISTIRAIYNEDADIVILFANRFEHPDDVELALWHEQAHYIEYHLDMPNKLKLLNSCLQYLKEKYPATYENIVSFYKDEAHPYEAIAELFDQMAFDYGTDRLLNSEFNGNSDVATLVSEIIKHTKDGKEKSERDRLRQSRYDAREGKKLSRVLGTNERHSFIQPIHNGQVSRENASGDVRGIQGAASEIGAGDGGVMFKLRTDPAPRKTGIGYKVFVLKDGKLYPPMVANPGGEDTPVGVWLDADAAPIAEQSKTGRNKVKAGGKGTQGGSGTLAYRPGWHLGEIPYALQFNRLNPETGEKELFPANFVWAEVEYANDVDYQDEAMSYGIKPSGKFQHSLAGLPRLPENGSYKYRTNPNPETDPWVITGAMRVKRLLTPSEVDVLVERAGRAPQQRQEGAVTDAEIRALNEQLFGDEAIKLKLRGKPRRKDGESLISYNKRLKQWQAEKEAAMRDRSIEESGDLVDPIGKELGDLAEELMAHPQPKWNPGESKEDYLRRFDEWSQWIDTRGNEVADRMNELRQQAEAEKAAERTQEIETADLRLSPAEEIDRPVDDEGQLSDEEMREVRAIFHEKLGDMKIKRTKDQLKADIKQEIIERRRYIDSGNLEDAFFIDKLTKVAGKNANEVLAAIPDYIEGNYEGEVTHELVEAAKLVSAWFDEVYNLMAQEGVLYDAPKIQGYVTHIWDWKRSPLDAQEKYTNYVNTMRMRSPYTRHRVIPSYAEGKKMGMVPKYPDIRGIITEYGHYATETIANHRIVEFLKSFKYDIPASDGEMPHAMDLIVPESVKDADYSRMNHTALDGYKVLNILKPMIAPVFGDQRIVDPSHLSELTNKLVDGIWLTSGAMKKIALSFSFFHHGALTETAVSMLKPWNAGKVIAKNLIWDVITKGNIPAMNDKEAARDAVKHLVSLGASNDYAVADVANLTTQLYRWTKDNNLPVAREAAALLDFLNKGQDKILWDVIHDGFKIASFAKLAKEIREKARISGWDERTTERALDEAGQLVNDTYGGLHFDILGFSPKSVRMMRALLLSPDWTLATVRQALSPFGFGKLYKSDTFWKALDGQERKAAKAMAEAPAAMRKKYGRQFWLTAGIFFYGLMNGLNAYFRIKDEEEAKKQADEMRKVDPSYKSAYELAYPDGMKWYDYTMAGNSLGHQTHLFTGHYEDGTETYVRWGKQFRELPELFFGRDGFSIPGPMIDKMAGKANPLLSTTFEFISGYSLSGWEVEAMKDKKGWERDVARLYLLATKFVPYSVPTQEDKEFMAIDLLMPSSKGMTPGKAINYFEKAIKAGDSDFVGQVYQACVMNGLEAEKYFDVAKARIEAEVKQNMLEGVETVEDALKAYDATDDARERARYLKYIEQQMGAQDYEQITRDEMIEQAQEVINGTRPTKVENQRYVEQSSSDDVMQDYRLKKTISGLKKYYTDYTELLSVDAEAARRMLTDKRIYIQGYQLATKYRTALTKLKKQMGHGRDAEIMAEIRRLRSECFEKLGALAE